MTLVKLFELFESNCNLVFVLYRMVTDRAIVLDLMRSFLINELMLDEFKLVISTGFGKFEFRVSAGEPFALRPVIFEPLEDVFVKL